MPVQYVCTVCGYVLELETSTDTIPENWICPVCGANKSKLKEK